MIRLRIVTDATCHRKPNYYKGNSVGAAHFYDADTGELIAEHCFVLGELTPYAAERQTVLESLDKAAEITRESVEIWTDAEHIVRHMSGDYLLKKRTSKEFFDRAKQLEVRFKIVRYIHHSRVAKSSQAVHNAAAKAYQTAHV